MKLNLWLIANRLSGYYDIETKITSSIERTISGPLPVQSTGSVYVRNEGTDIICSAEQGTIIVHDVEEKEGFLLIRSIFNWYDNWYDSINNALRVADYRLFVHLCAQAFSNPVMLQDSNSLLLGMDCRGIPISSIPEWRFLYETEQSSMAYYLAISNALNDSAYKYSDCVYRFNTRAKDEAGNEYQTSGLLAKFRFLAHDYGQITILDKKKKINPGDISLLMMLADMGSLLFAATDRGDNSAVNRRFMNDLLDHKEVSREQLNYQRSLIIGNASEKSGRFCLFVFHYDTPGDKSALVDLLFTSLARKYPALYGWVYHEDLLYTVFVPEPNILARQMLSYIESQGYANKLHLGVSLPFGDIDLLPCYYEQAIYAIHNGAGDVKFFYNCAYNYLLENVDSQHKLAACEPFCRKMWEEEPDKREFLLTLSAYLRLERSTALTAEHLYIHRNTVNYRMKYLKNCSGWDYEDAAVRDYLRISIHYLNRWC